MANIKINYDNIKEIKLIGGRPEDRKTWSQVVKEYPDADYILNGGLFDTASGWSTVDTIQDGEIINGGNYTNVGFAFVGDTLKMMTTEEAKSNGYKSFLGGGPTLIVNNNISIDSTGLGNWFCEVGTAIRLGIGKNNNNDLTIFWSDDKITLRNLASLMFENGCTEAIALDGGGSTNIFAKRDNKWEPVNNQTENRRVPTWILVYLKKPLTNEEIETNKKKRFFCLFKRK